MTAYGQFCPVSKAAEVLFEKWTILILREFLMGTTRFNDFQRAISRISPTLLTKRLKYLEEKGVIVRKQVSGQRGHEYRLTPAGKELEPLLENIAVWGMRWARGQMSDDELDVELLMWDSAGFKQRIFRMVKQLSALCSLIWKNTEAGGSGLTGMKSIYARKIPVRMLICIFLPMCERWRKFGKEISI